MLRVLVLLALWLLPCLLLGYLATRRPHPISAEPVPELSWAKLQPLRLRTADGEELGAWFLPGRADRPVVLLLHGHRGRRGDCLRQARIFAEAGCGTLLVSLRAHGDSSGDFNDVGYSSRRDVDTAVAWIEQNQRGRAIVVYGQSMGAAAAVFAAELLGTRVQGYILESPYQDLRTAVWNRITAFVPSFVAVVPYVGLLTVAPVVLPDLDRISPCDAVRNIPVAVPVLILAGKRDVRALPAEAQAICDRIAGHAALVLIDGTHSRLHDADASGYHNALVEFVARVR